MSLSSHIRPEPNPPLDRARVIRAREMYAGGFTVSRILAHCQMSYGTLYACLDGVPFGQDGERMEPIPRRRDVTGKRRRALVADDVSLVNRLTRTAERQVRDIETQLSARDAAPVERERCVRMLVGLTRALPQAERGRSRFRCRCRRRRGWGLSAGRYRCDRSRTLAQDGGDGGRCGRHQTIVAGA
jgi:hypothetical protein